MPWPVTNVSGHERALPFSSSVRYQQQTSVTSKAKPRCIVFGSRGVPAAVCKHGPCARPVHARDEMGITANSLAAVLLLLSLRLSSLPPLPHSFGSCGRRVCCHDSFICLRLRSFILSRVTVNALHCSGHRAPRGQRRFCAAAVPSGARYW